MLTSEMFIYALYWLSGGGEVCMEFLKVRRGEEQVVEVMRVSGDGQRVVIYTPGLSRFAFWLSFKLFGNLDSNVLGRMVSQLEQHLLQFLQGWSQ